MYLHGHVVSVDLARTALPQVLVDLNHITIREGGILDVVHAVLLGAGIISADPSARKVAGEGGIDFQIVDVVRLVLEAAIARGELITAPGVDIRALFPKPSSFSSRRIIIFNR